MNKIKKQTKKNKIMTAKEFIELVNSSNFENKEKYLLYRYNGEIGILMYEDEAKDLNFGDRFDENEWVRGDIGFYKLNEQVADFLLNGGKTLGTVDVSYGLDMDLSPIVSIDFAKIRCIENENTFVYEWVTDQYYEYDDAWRELVMDTDSRYYADWTSERHKMSDQIKELINEYENRDILWYSFHNQMVDLRNNWNDIIKQYNIDNDVFQEMLEYENEDYSFDSIIECYGYEQDYFAEKISYRECASGRLDELINYMYDWEEEYIQTNRYIIITNYGYIRSEKHSDEYFFEIPEGTKIIDESISDLIMDEFKKIEYGFFDDEK